MEKENKYKIIASDLDGTFLMPDQMMGLIGAGNNPQVLMTVAVEEASK